MDIATDLGEVNAQVAAGRPTCFVTGTADVDAVRSAAKALGVTGVFLELALIRNHRHPIAHVEDGQVAMVLFAADVDARPFSVYLQATPSGLLVVLGDGLDSTWVRAAAQLADGPLEGLTAVVTAVARDLEERVDDLADAVGDAEGEAAGMTSTKEREYLMSTRARVFALQYLTSAQRRLVGPDSDVAEALPSAERPLRQAAAKFDHASASLSQVYALLGDALARQSSVINERLTLVNTIYLPLTLAASFFGMNFGWMVYRIGSAPAFVLLGIVLPVMLSVVTMLVLRRLGR